jgi:hypothetical protein
VLNRYQSSILFINGGHIHESEFRSSISKNFPDLNVAVLVTPSLTPLFYNNPGYTVADFNKGIVSNLHMRHFQLFEYIFLSSKRFTTIDFESLFGFSINQPDSIRSFL